MTKSLGFELELKTSNEKQNIVYTTLGGNDIFVTTNSLYLYIPSFVSSPEQQHFLTNQLGNVSLHGLVLG